MELQQWPRVSAVVLVGCRSFSPPAPARALRCAAAVAAEPAPRGQAAEGGGAATDPAGGPQSRKLRLALICSQAQTTSASRASSSRRPPFMSGCRSLTSALYCWRISALLWLSWASRISSARRSVGGSRRCGARRPLAAGVQRRLVAEQLHRVVEAEALPGPPLRVRLGAGPVAALAEGPGRPAPHPVRREMPLQVLRRSGTGRSSTSDCTRARGRGRTTGIRRAGRASAGRGTCPAGRSRACRRPGPRSPPRPTARARAPAASCRRSPRCRNRRAGGGSFGWAARSRWATRAPEFSLLPRRAKARRRGGSEMTAADDRMADGCAPSSPRPSRPTSRGGRRERAAPRPRRLARGRRHALPRGDARGGPRRLSRVERSRAVHRVLDGRARGRRARAGAGPRRRGAR